MPAMNILANLFVTLDNTESRRKDECIVVPTSKLAIEVLHTLKKDGYINDFEHIEDNRMILSGLKKNLEKRVYKK